MIIDDSSPYMSNLYLKLFCDQDYWRRILTELIHIKESEGWIQEDLLEVDQLFIYFVIRFVIRGRC